MLFRVRAKRHKLAAARVCEHDVELALFLLDLREKAVKVCKLRDVALYRRDVAADLLHRALKRVLPTPGDVHIRALGDKALRSCQTDPAVAARHQGDLSVKLSHHLFLRAPSTAVERCFDVHRSDVSAMTADSAIGAGSAL